MAPTPSSIRALGPWLKHQLIPGRLYIRYRAGVEQRRGEREIRLLPFLIDPKRESIDVGANKGVYTHVMANLARHVHAFEPNPKMCRLLRKTAARNVTTYEIALSNQPGTATLRIPYGSKGHSNQGASLSTAKVARNFTPLTVETRRIDDYRFDDVGFIKIDVEGFEDEVIAGAAETIARCRPTLLVEIEEKHTKIPIERSLERVLGLGYSGLFLLDGTLRELGAFDPEEHHRRAQKSYVFNFIFLPSGTAAPAT
jgi:FkbM family methyltransferase